MRAQQPGSLTKYHLNAIVNDYDHGLPLSKLAGKYGISISHARKIVLSKRRKLRTTSEAMAMASGAFSERWHKLTRTARNCRAPTRLISMPGAVLRRLSINSEAKLQSRWTAMAHHRLGLEVVEGGRGRRKEGWHKLTRFPRGQGRITSVPSKQIRSIGFNPGRDLSGRWRVSRGSLFLEIQYSDRVRGARIAQSRGRRLWRIIQWVLKCR